MYFPIDTNSYAKEKSIRVFIFSSCFSFQVFFFWSQELQITIIWKFKKFYNYEIYLVSNVKITNKL